MPLAAFPKCFLEELTVRRTMTVEQWIDMAADQLDVDGLEFYWGFTPRGDDAALLGLRRRMAARGLVMPMLCCSPDFTQPQKADRDAEVEAQKRAIEATASLGGHLCRVLSGQRRPGVSRADGLQMAAECILALLPHAESHGVTLILENHYKDGFWQFPEFAQQTDVFLELLSLVPPSPWFGVNFDPSNALIAGEDPLVLLRAVQDRVVSMHASDRSLADGKTLTDLRRLDASPQAGYAPFLRHGVVGQGLNDYNQIFAILRERKFTGWISIEDGDDPVLGMEHLSQSAAFLRGKMAEYGLP